MSSLLETRYAKSGDNYVAYQIMGEGPFDLVYVPASSHTLTCRWSTRFQQISLGNLPPFAD
jgi:hypothetical protein